MYLRIQALFSSALRVLPTMYHWAGMAQEGSVVATLEERVSAVEGHADAHTRAIDAVRQDIAGLRTEVAAIRSEMAFRSDVAALRAEMADLRRDMMAGDAALRAEILELRSEMNRRFDMMDKKFLWLAGTQVATLLAVVGVLAGALYR